MVNASLNWASIVGIVLVIFGGYIFFLRSFKPSISRDLDPFLAVISWLCGGILFFQGWRLDPILQFGQCLLVGTTIWVTYDNLKLRKIEFNRDTVQDKFEPLPYKPNSLNAGNKIRRKVDDWDNVIDRKRTSVKCSYCGASVDI